MGQVWVDSLQAARAARRGRRSRCPYVALLHRPCSPGRVKPGALPSRRGGGSGYVVIQRYGEQYEKKGGGGGKKRRARAVRLLYSGSNHYDLLLSK